MLFRSVELFISPKTASVHVTSILRKLGVTTRVQAAAVGERAGLLHDQRASGGLRELVKDVTPKDVQRRI